MLSVFPSLFSYQLAVPLVFRIVIGLAFFVFGCVQITRSRTGKTGILTELELTASPFWLWAFAAFEMVGGLLLAVGLYTQVVALIFSVMLFLAVVGKYKRPEAISLSQGTLLLLLLITASLLFLGPGFYAFDLPL